MAAVFISYRREDSAGYAGRLHEELAQRLGTDRVFRDVDTLRAGQDFVNAIDLRLRQCNALVAVIGRDWLHARTAAGKPRLDQPDDYVALEIAAALQRPDVLVVPVLVGGATVPSPSELPERIRALARRHAITLRDETWESDVDRLAAVLDASRGKRSSSLNRQVLILIPVLIAVVATFLLLRKPGESGSRAALPASTSPAGDPASAPSDPRPAPAPTAAYAVDIPALAEFSHGELIYSLISGNVHPRGNLNALRLRFRVSNEGRYDASLWDASFRLAIGDEVLTPSGGLNELVAGRSIKQAIVTFTFPADARRGVLQVLGGNDVAELPLDLSPSGRAIEDEKADAGDAHSRARMASMLRDPRPLIAGESFSSTLVRVTSRHFVNKIRIVVWIRIANEGRVYDISNGAVTLRLAHEGDLLAPVKEPIAAIRAGSTFNGDVIFEVPTSAKSLELRATAGNQSVNIPLEVR